MSIKKLLKNELIGSRIEIIESNNKTLIGKKGKIIDETKNTFTIKNNIKEIKVIKSHITIKINGQEIQGKKLVSRPQDRIRK